MKAPRFSYQQYVLFAFLTAYVLNFIDRQILVILMEPIKEDLNLSDTQLGFMSGFAFAIFYTTLGIPIARLADRGNRVNIISGAIALWSAMTAFSGMAMNFWQLVIARIGVGVGEAGCTPPAHSLITDYFPRAERARAISIYMMGVPIGVLGGFLLGGWLNELYNWRIAFIAMGVPGLVLALIMKLTVKEPKRGQFDELDHEAQANYNLHETFRFLWRNRTFRHLVAAMALVAFVGAGIAQWQASFFIRYHGMGTGELGTWLSLMIGLVGALGTYLGGYISTRLGPNSEALQLRLLALVAVLILPVGIFWLSWPNRYIALLAVGLYAFLYFLHYGPAFAKILAMTPGDMRAMASAITLFTVNLVGTGIGPLASGALSDALVPVFGAGALRAAMMILFFVALWAAWHFWRAAASLRGGSAMDEARAAAVAE